jgi:hypothetical protein
MPKISPVNLAYNKEFSQIDWGNLKEADILEKDKDGIDLLHHTAHEGFWEKIPKKYQNKKYWTIDSEGRSIYMCALIGGKNNTWVKKEDLTEKDILKKDFTGDFIAEHGVRYGYFKEFSPKAITYKVLVTESNASTNDKIIHILARAKQFHCIPKDLITEDLLNIKGEYNETIFHILCGKDQINEIPVNLLTRENLTTQSETGVTPLHRLVSHSRNLIPKDITLDDLLIETKHGSTAMHSWTGDNNWVNIPEKFLTMQSLEVKDIYGSSPLSNIIDLYKDGWASRADSMGVLMTSKIKEILTKISQKELNKLVKDRSPAISSLAKKETIKRKVTGHNKSQTLDIN